jgi:cobalt-zinc-cadmium resistance protein CzcA
LDLQHQILKEADGIFSKAIQKSKLRFETGETDLVQYKDIELQKSQINFQLKDLELKQLELISKFNLLIQTKEKYIPDYIDVTNPIVFAEINSAIDNHPKLNTLKQQLLIAQSKTKLEKNSLLPELHFGYYSTTIRGVGADNKFYDGNARFNSLQFGIGLPLFFQTQQAKIRAAKVQELIYQEQYDYEKQSLTIQIENAISRYKSTYEKVNYYETALLNDNKLMIDKATKKFELGEINYLEWAMLMQHTIQTKTNYTDAIYELNLCINELNYLTSK